MDGITDSMDRSLSKLREIVKNREVCCAAVHGVSKSLNTTDVTSCACRDLRDPHMLTHAPMDLRAGSVGASWRPGLGDRGAVGARASGQELRWLLSVCCA